MYRPPNQVGRQLISWADYGAGHHLHWLIMVGPSSPGPLIDWGALEAPLLTDDWLRGVGTHDRQLSQPISGERAAILAAPLCIGNSPHPFPAMGCMAGVQEP